MNSLTFTDQWKLDEILTWFDAEPELRVVVITGKGKSFSAGQDLAEQQLLQLLKAKQESGEKVEMPPRQITVHPRSGFAGISKRVSKKPIIAAVNGWALGGGFELCLNCDIVVASPKAQFGLPEALRGLYAAAGGLARLVRLVGLTIASDIALTGRNVSAEEAFKYHIINRVSKTPESVVEEALEYAAQIASSSPDAILITRYGLRQALEFGSVDRAALETDLRYGAGLRDSENLKIGLRAFAEKKIPQWVPSKL